MLLTSFYGFIKKTILLNQKKVCFYLFIKKVFFTRSLLYISFFLFVFCLLTILCIFVSNNIKTIYYEFTNTHTNRRQNPQFY